MANFMNFQKSPSTSISLQNAGDCDEKNAGLSKAAITFRIVKELHILSISNIENHYQSIQHVTTATSIAITISTTSYSCSSSPTLRSSDGGREFLKPRQRKQHAQHRQYVVPGLNTDLSSDDGYSSCHNDRRKSDNCRRSGNRIMSKACTNKSSRPRSISTSSTESGVFSGDDRNYQPLPSGCVANPVNSNRNDLGIRQNFSKDHRFARNFQGMPTSATHFSSSKIFNAPAASTLPQPPQRWLLGRAKGFVNEENSADEQERAKKADTFDFYNLNMLLSVEA
ncbi:PREDICTED: uncharacterized protein LOC108974668 [Bactrocera latifrons]|uniref:uncharacterized protein LOC108974668 n=1 Tax=Bactrocera latifrons TaxID=174628 RepID=UPI0008DE81E3|nr:PREDICTED: uncharacterized protein LOC108974668 [Bactrocera latifrons]